MRRSTILAGVLTALILLAATTAAAATDNPPTTKGRGYGGPPKSAEERQARQQACPCGACLGGGFQAGRHGRGCGWGQGPQSGAGFGGRHGLRDGTGPRRLNGACPATVTPANER